MGSSMRLAGFFAVTRTLRHSSAVRSRYFICLPSLATRESSSFQASSGSSAVISITITSLECCQAFQRTFWQIGGVRKERHLVRAEHYVHLAHSPLGRERLSCAQSAGSRRRRCQREAPSTSYGRESPL